MKKIIVTTLCVLTAFVCFSSSPLEARRHCRSTNVSVGIGQTYAPANNVYVVRQYAQPAVVYTPGYYAAAPYYAPVYMAPAPAYVEQVYVTRPVPSLFSGLSFSWNFFR